MPWALSDSFPLFPWFQTGFSGSLALSFCFIQKENYFNDTNLYWYLPCFFSLISWCNFPCLGEPSLSMQLPFQSSLSTLLPAESLFSPHLAHFCWLKDFILNYFFIIFERFLPFLDSQDPVYIIRSSHFATHKSY